MSDPLDIAADRAELERAALIAAHAERMRSPIPVCEECDERRVHVTERGVRWRYCAPCAADLTGVVP